jgi:16S rRNA (cytidine1402-2'-O)-methyltransferase
MSSHKAASRKLQAGTETSESGLQQGLYVVATPIGNMADITERAKKVLASVDMIACEDTRHTGRLLHRLGIKNRLTAYHDHSDERRRQELISRLENGESIAIVSDAGTPTIADPGFKLVRDAANKGIDVKTVPGANAAIAALSISGIPTDSFLFIGFLPARPTARRLRIETLRDVEATVVLYENGTRLARTLTDLLDFLGDRDVAVAREMTKIHEEVRRGSLAELARALQEANPPKGEIVVVVAPAREKNRETFSSTETDAMLTAHAETMSPRKAASAVAELTGRPSKELYARLVTLKASKNE